MRNSMTIERAIEILNPESRESYDMPGEINEACKLAIAALELLERMRQNAITVGRIRRAEENGRKNKN